MGASSSIRNSDDDRDLSNSCTIFLHAHTQRLFTVGGDGDCKQSRGGNRQVSYNLVFVYGQFDLIERL